jgi:hypothetical protein
LLEVPQPDVSIESHDLPDEWLDVWRVSVKGSKRCQKSGERKEKRSTFVSSKGWARGEGGLS